MDPEVSRALAQLKEAMKLGPGEQLQQLQQEAETANSLDEIQTEWIRRGLVSLGYNLG